MFKTDPMKSCKPLLLVVLFFAALHSHAQRDLPHIKEQDYNKPKLFADLPQKFLVDAAMLEQTLLLPVGEGVNLPLYGAARFKGVVVSKSDPADVTVQSVVIKSTNRTGAVLTFTRTRNEEGNIIYLGRIVSLSNSDAYRMVQENGKYALVKQHLFDTLSE